MVFDLSSEDFRSDSRFDPSGAIIDSKFELSSFKEHLIFEDDEEADEFKELVISILRRMVFDPSVDFLSDYLFDPSGAIADYRFEFSFVEELFDVILASFDCPYRNLDKELLMKLTSAWEQSIQTVREFWIQKALSELVWLPAMWMQVIGCPAIVHSQEELLFLLLVTLVSIEEFSQAAVVRELVKLLSFRPKLAQWIAFHMFYRTEYLDEYLLDISEPLDRNSFLLQSIIDGQSAVQYTHLHKKSKENYALVEPVNLQLKVGDSDVVVANITTAVIVDGSSKCSANVFSTLLRGILTMS